MHDIMPPLAATAQLIQSYGAGGFRIGNTEYAAPVLVLADRTHAWDGEFTEASLAPLFTASPAIEILLIGTGKRHEMLPPATRQWLKLKGLLGVDTMDTGAACRTFNVLLGEARRVAVVLRLPQEMS